MIRAEVNVIGTIKRSAGIRTDRNNIPYLSFPITVSLTDKTGTVNTIDVYVSLPNAQQSDLALFTENIRVAVSGTMDIRKKDDHLAFYLPARSVSLDGVAALDAVSGTMTFRGHLKKENIFDERTTKNGRPYLLFSAYSAEKVGTGFVSTWVTFMRFPEKEATIESVRPDWFAPRAHLDITGDLRLSFYKGTPSLSCIVREMSEHINNS